MVDFQLPLPGLTRDFNEPTKSVRHQRYPAGPQHLFGYICHTCFTSEYREFGQALPHSAIYRKLKPLRTGIERTFGLVKENRYRMEQTNFYKGLDNVTIHAVEHDIVLFLSWHVFESTAEH